MVRRTGAPLPVRASAILLAALLSALPLLMLLYGLSVQAIEAIRSTPTVVELLPLPEPEPPPPPVRVEPQVERQRPAPAAPASASPPPAAAPDATIVVTPAPPLAPSGVTDWPGGSGGGSSTGDGNGSGGGGTGGARPAPVLTQASWKIVPGDAEIMPFDPPRAWRERVNGNVLLRCNVLRTGKPANCRVAGERPRGWGFGEAALGASRNFLLNPPTRDGVPDEKIWVEIPVAFNHRRSRP